MFAAESSAFTQARHSRPPANDTVNFHTAATPTAWDDAAAASFAVTNPVLSVGHFIRALLGYSWRAPTSLEFYISRQRAAQLLDVSLSSVDKLIATGQLPAFRVLRAVRLRLEDVLRQAVPR